MKLSELKPYTKDLTLLIVEDDNITRSTLVTIFGRLFKLVEEASDGQEGLEMYQKDPHRYDMIFSDINMPRMNGLEMIKQIRKDDLVVPIMVLSAHNETDKLIELINAGADTFIQKPFTANNSFGMIYRLAVRISDAKMLDGYIQQIEEQNALLLKQQQDIIRHDRALKVKIWQENQRNADTLVQRAPAAQQSVATPTAVTPIATVVTPAIGTDHPEYHSQLLKEDIDELIDLADEIENYVFLTFQGSIINEGYIDKLASSFQRFGSILYRYSLFNALASALFDLANGINENKASFVSKQEFILPFLENLIFVLHKYVDDIWKKASSDPHFYDASMMNDIETFITIVKGEKGAIANAEDLVEFF